jgi:hypothetical protein
MWMLKHIRLYVSAFILPLYMHAILVQLYSYRKCIYQRYHSYKTPYVRNNADDLSDGKLPQTDIFSNPFGIPLFTGFFGLAYGFVMY